MRSNSNPVLNVCMAHYQREYSEYKARKNTKTHPEITNIRIAIINDQTPLENLQYPILIIGVCTTHN